MSWIASEVTPSSLAELADVLAGNASGLPWLPKGGGTLLGRGALPRKPVALVDLSRCTTVIEHAYDDLTVTVEAGMRMTSLQETLSTRGQWLPLSLDPHPASTVGGWIGADRRTALAGSWGSVRDYLLGMAWMDGRGHTLRAGGRVVKNVAGYDLMKVFTGSLGELGIVVEATFKVLPRPARWGGVTITDPDTIQLRAALEQGPKLFPAGLWRYDLGNGETLALVFAGSATRVHAQVKRAETLFGRVSHVLSDDECLNVVATLERNSRPESDTVAWGGVLPEWLCRSGLGTLFESKVWCADLMRGHFWSRWNADDATLSRARDALRGGEGHLHLDASSSTEPLSNPWGWQDEGNDLRMGLKRALDPEGCWVEGRWPVSQ